MAPVDLDLDRALAVARRAARAGADVALSHFRRLRAADIDRKDDRSLVTVADRQAEQAIASAIRAAFPDHAILGEEGGAQSGATSQSLSPRERVASRASRVRGRTEASQPPLTPSPSPGGRGGKPRWIIDPIDGTRAFAAGGDYWGPLVALESSTGDMLVGVAILPAIGREYHAARGGGCFRDGEQVQLAPADAPEKAWRDAVLSMGSLPRLLSGVHRDAAIELARTCAYAYAGCDLAGCLLLLDGAADVWIESGVRIWDIAALKILVEEAGGVFSDFEGGSDLSRGEAVAGSPALCARALQALNTDKNREA